MSIYWEQGEVLTRSEVLDHYYFDPVMVGIADVGVRHYGWGESEPIYETEAVLLYHGAIITGAIKRSPVPRIPSDV